MISVLIETLNDEEALALTLGSLVGGAVEGILREVMICDLGSTDQTAYVAEHAGCTFLASGGVPAGTRSAKGEWLLIVEPGARLVDGWTEAVRSHIAKSVLPARFARSRIDRSPFLARVFSGNRALAEGLLISKPKAIALAKTAASAEAMARGLATVRLGAEIRVAAKRERQPA